MVTVKVGKKDWQIADISFAEKRKLHMMNSLCFSGGEIDQEKYYGMLEAVRDMAGYGDGTANEKTLADLSMVEIDSLLQGWLIEYLGIGGPKKK